MFKYRSKFGDCHILRLQCSKLEDMGKAVPFNTTCTSRTCGGREMKVEVSYGEESAVPACGRRNVLA